MHNTNPSLPAQVGLLMCVIFRETDTLQLCRVVLALGLRGRPESSIAVSDLVVPPVQLWARIHGDRAGEAVVDVDGAALGVPTGVVGESLVDGEGADLGGLGLGDRWDFLVAVKGIEGGDGETVDYNGEDDEEVDDGDHGGD